MIEQEYSFKNNAPQEFLSLIKQKPAEYIESYSYLSYIKQKDCRQQLRIFQNLQNWNVQNFRANYINCPSIMKAISGIFFCNLKSLDLTGNKISNMESFCCIGMPYVENINLANNQIVSLKPLHKSRLQNMTVLQLSFNRINHLQISHLTRARFGKQNAVQLYMMDFQIQKIEERVQIITINQLLKLETGKSAAVYYQSGFKYRGNSHPDMISTQKVLKRTQQKLNAFDYSNIIRRRY